MVFQEGFDGTFCMTPQERVVMKFSQYAEFPLKDKTKSELIGNLNITGIDIAVVKGDRLSGLRGISHGNLISVTKRLSKESVKLWMVHPKGILQ